MSHTFVHFLNYVCFSMGIKSIPSENGGDPAYPLLDSQKKKENGTKSKPSKNGLSPNPEATASIISRITFYFMTHFFYMGCKKSLEVEDMFEPLPQHESERATAEMNDAWEREKAIAKKECRDASLMAAIRRTYWRDIAKFGILLFIEETIKLAQPLFMGRLIRYFRFDTPLTETEAYISATGVALTAALSALIHHPYFYGLQKIGMQLKIAASGMIVNKGVRLSSAALHKTTVGHMVNLLSTDVNKFDMGFIFLHYMWVSPLLLIAYSYFLWQEIGFSSFAGFGALIVLIPIQGYFSRQMGMCRREIAKRTDERISVMNEILNGIRVIKMYAWEGAFSQVIGSLRRREMQKVRANAVFQSLVMGLFWSSGKLIVLFAALCFVLTGNDLTAERIFVATALYNACRLPITLFLPFSVQFLFEVRVSIRRIQEFLELEEFSYLEMDTGKKSGVTFVRIEEPVSENQKLLYNENNLEKTVASDGASICSDVEPHIKLDNFTSTWQTVEDSVGNIFAVKNVNLSVKKGELIAVVGPVGAGKSSLLSSLLGEARCISGNFSMSGRVAYCAQDSWIFNGTIRDNVVFGNAFNEVKYHQALEVSALHADVDQLQRGDATLVGDRGTSLSGGQKARVALARAIYSDADIFLLDDPLSAVDAAVGRYLFDKCICGYLRTKVVILVTHQLQFLDKADLLLLMRNGEVVASGSPSQLKNSHAEQFAALIQETERTYARRSSESTAALNSPRNTSISEDGDIADDFSVVRSTSVISEKEKAVEFEGKTEYVSEVEQEDRADGAVEWCIYGQYIKAMCVQPWTIPPLLIIVFGVQLLFNITDWWLNKWTNAAERAVAMRENGTTGVSDQYSFFGLHLDIDIQSYMNIYTLLTLILVVASVIRCVWFRLSQTLASIALHQRMFDAVVNTHISFFDKNPIGRVLNRFSKDVGTMDDQLSFVFFEFLMGALNFVGIVGVILILNPIVFLPTLPLLILFFLLRIVYLASSRDVKRLEATTRSPLYSHISAVMHGLITVRAFCRQNDVLKQYHQAQNINSAAFGLSLSTARWFAVCIDWLVALFVTVVAFFCVLTPANTSSGEVALMLVYAVQLTGFFSWIMRQSAELQNGMVSVERIVHYSELESEHCDEGRNKVPSSWPNEGHIKMEKMFMKYDENEFVLKNINLDIKPKEKIGIVGRTGAGKSSLLRALFRLTPPCNGAVYIDGVNTATVPLKTLRRSISIIPQEPVLFVGSLRRNLDPFSEYEDGALWDALQQVELKSVVSELPGGLEASMHEGGANFSVGQRQLVCLARALLRHSHILVIDEATANVDPTTDSLIQSTIRSRFADSTVLTIAHRLNTIMDSTRVLVLRDGEVAEFGPAYELLKIPDSILTSLVEETGKANADILRKMAEEAFLQLQ